MFKDLKNDVFEDEIIGSELYHVIEDPVNLSDFSTELEPIKGLNPVLDHARMDFDLSIDSLINLLFNEKLKEKKLKDASVTTTIDENIKKIVEDLSKEKITDFLNDNKLVYRRVAK